MLPETSTRVQIIWGPYTAVQFIDMQRAAQPGEPATGDVSQLLYAWSGGDPNALESLTPIVYRELHRLASHYMKRERPGHSLQTTDLVNEAYMRLVDYKRMQWQNRAHFFAISAQLMRRILVEHARRHNLKRGGGVQQVSLDQAAVVGSGRAKVQPVFVGDVAAAAVAVLARPDTAKSVFELGGPRVYTYRELAALTLREIDRHKPIIGVPAGLMKIAAFFAEFPAVLGLTPQITRDQVDLLVHDNVVRPGAKDLASLGIVPTAAEVILPTYLDRFRIGGRYNQHAPA